LQVQSGAGFGQIFPAGSRSASSRFCRCCGRERLIAHPSPWLAGPRQLVAGAAPAAAVARHWVGGAEQDPRKRQVVAGVGDRAQPGEHIEDLRARPEAAARVHLDRHVARDERAVDRVELPARPQQHCVLGPRRAATRDPRRDLLRLVEP